MSEDEGASIGEVSERAGIPVETLRTWERRYGFPDPERTESGHRRYDDETVLKLELISQALEHGHRAGQLVELELSELQELLEVTAPEAASPPPPEPEPSHQQLPASRSGASSALIFGGTRKGGEDETVERWIGLVRSYEVEELAADFERCWYRHGVLDFVTRYAPKFLKRLGQSWEHGSVDVAQEHVASERFREFLSAQWRPLSARANGPRVVCALLPEEQHVLGLHLVATLLALSGCRVVFLGADTPLESIAQATIGLQARALCVSVSQAARPGRARHDLLWLSEALGEEDIAVLIGGSGVPMGLDQIEQLELAELPRRVLNLGLT